MQRDIYKESVELTPFIRLKVVERPWSKINATIPHTRIDMRYQDAECALSHISKQE